MLSRIAAVACAALALAACQKGQTTAQRTDCVAPTGRAINLYTARHYDADTQLYDAFKCETGIEIKRLEMEPDQLIERMKAEGERSLADVVLMADAGALSRAVDAGLLQPLTTPVLEQKIPASLRETSGLWWGFSRRARVIAYDKTKVDPSEITTYDALADPKFRGQVCVRNSDNVYNLSLMAALIEHRGPQRALAWAKGVVANMARPPSGGDIDQIRAVGAGACQLALTNTYYYLRIKTSQNPGDMDTASRVELAFPDLDGAGTHVNISGGGLAAHVQHRDDAIKFLEFLTSDEAQGIFAGANHEYPAVEGVTPPADVEAYSHFKADPLSVATYGEHQAQAQNLFDQAGWR